MEDLPSIAEIAVNDGRFTTLVAALDAAGLDLKIQVKMGKVYINDALVIITDLKASNGIVHVVDTVILPPM